MSRLPVESLETKANELDLGDAKTYHLPDWANLSHPQRLSVMRQISMMRGRDPRIAKLAVNILRRSGAGPRQYDLQAAALLKWVQDPRNVYYVNEPGERLQDPIYTIKVGQGDCFAEDTLVLRDDMEFVKIQDVQVGSRIWGKDQWTTVVNFWDKGVLPITEIELNNGSVMRLTEDHKVYVKSCEMHGPTCKDLVEKRRNCFERKFSWVRLHVSELVEGMVLLQPEQIHRKTTESAWDADTSWLMGAYLAEGWSEDCRISISGKDGHWKEQTKHRAKEVAERKGWHTRWHPKYLSINSREAAEWVAPCGKGAVNKIVPLDAMQNADLDALEVGLRLDASQNTRGEGWTFGTTSLRMAQQYRTIQRALGRSTSWAKVENHGGLGSNPIYRVGVRNPTQNRDRRLKIKTIRRGVCSVPCYDIATEDHYVYLPEADCTVSNCDDQCILLAALYESVGLPWKFVLSGRNSVGEKLRYIEGDPLPEARWAHIYLAVGTPPFNPVRWYFAETTIVGVPLGWDVIDGDTSYLPEMGTSGQTPRFLAPKPAPAGYRPPPLPPKENRSPAYDQVLAHALGELDSALGVTPLDFAATNLVGSSVGTYMADEMLEEHMPKGTSKWKEWGTAIATGVLVSVGTTLVLNFINGQGLWQGKGTLLQRLKT